jgi:hypothetical protein
VIPGLCRIFPNGGEGWLPTSCELQRRLMPLHVCLSGIDPAALKYALSLRGFMHPTTRLPIVPLDEPAKAAINEAVAGIREHEFAPIDGQHRMMGPLGASDLCKPYIADAVSPSNSYTPSTIFADATLVPNSRK